MKEEWKEIRNSNTYSLQQVFIELITVYCWIFTEIYKVYNYVDFMEEELLIIKKRSTYF